MNFKDRTDKPKSPTTGANAVKGVINFLKGKGLDEDDLGPVTRKYNSDIMSISFSLEDKTPVEQVFCNEIQKDFGKFVKWFKENY